MGPEAVVADRVFVDTSGWYALIDRNDPAHPKVAALVARLAVEGCRLVTSDYVVDESSTLAKARSGSRTAFRLLDLLKGTAAVDLEWIGANRFRAAEDVFRRYHDQSFSFTDCTSFALMRELRISRAITTDEHFRVAGFQILPADA